MYPKPFGYPSFAVLLPLAVLVGCATALYLTGRAGRSRARMAVALAVLSAAGLLGAKLYSILERGPFSPLTDELVSGYRHPGAFAGLAVGAAVLWVLFPAGALLAMLDDLVPGTAFAGAVMRVSCLLNGCCAGAVCSYPWCLRFPRFSPAWEQHLQARAIDGTFPASLPVHPLQLYFGLWLIALGVSLIRFTPRRAYPGQVVLAYVALDNLAKLPLELLRDPPEPHLRWMAAVLAGAASLVLLVGWRAGWGRRAGAAAAGATAIDDPRCIAPVGGGA